MATIVSTFLHRTMRRDVSEQWGKAIGKLISKYLLRTIMDSSLRSLKIGLIFLVWNGLRVKGKEWISRSLEVPTSSRGLYVDDRWSSQCDGCHVCFPRLCFLSCGDWEHCPKQSAGEKGVCLNL